MNGNFLIDKFKKKEKIIGAFFTTGTQVVAEVLGGVGFDFIVIDAEHCRYDLSDVELYIRAAESRGLTPFVRVVDCSRGNILKMLDLGAMGLFLPVIKTADEVKDALKLAKYPPVGERGLGHGHKAGYGVDPIANTGRPEDYLEWANANTLIIPQCETAEAVENIYDILSLEGVAGIFIGPFDLSISMGIPCQFDNPKFLAAVRRVRDACEKAGKMSLTVAMAPEASKQWFDMGFDGVLTQDTALFIKASQNYMSGIKALGY